MWIKDQSMQYVLRVVKELFRLSMLFVECGVLLPAAVLKDLWHADSGIRFC